MADQAAASAAPTTNTSLQVHWGRVSQDIWDRAGWGGVEWAAAFVPTNASASEVPTIPQADWDWDWVG